MKCHELDLARMVQRIKNQWFGIILIELAIIGLTIAAILFWPRTYRADAKLFVQVGRETIGVDPTATTGSTIGLTALNRDSEIKSVLETLGSRQIMDMVVKDLGAEVVLGDRPVDSPEPAGRSFLQFPTLPSLDPIALAERAVIQMEEHLTVHAERDSCIVYVAYDSDSPELATAVVDALVNAYLSLHPQLHRNESSLDFFEQQQMQMQNRLADTQDALRQAKNTLGAASVDGYRAKLELQVGQVEAEQLNVSRAHRAANAKILDIQQQLQSTPNRIITSQVDRPNTAADLLRQELYSLQVQAMQLEAKYSDQHPKVIMIRRQVAEAQAEQQKEKTTRQESTTEVNPVYQQLLTSLSEQQHLVASYQGQLQQCEQQLQNLHDSIALLNQAEIDIERLERNAQVAKNNLMLYADKAERARVDQALQQDHISNIKVLQPPHMWQKPISPSKTLLLAGGLLICLTFPLCYALVMEYLNINAATENASFKEIWLGSKAKSVEST